MKWPKNRVSHPSTFAVASATVPNIIRCRKLTIVSTQKERQALATLKAQMRGLATAYASKLPYLDAQSLVLGLEGISLKYLPMQDRDGVYDPEHRVILINSRVRPERQRFTLAHEISHALMLQDDDLLSDLHDVFEGERLEEVIETLCNVGAAAILIPTKLLSEMTARFGHTGRTLAELMRRADVSATVAMYTLCEVAVEPMMYTFCACINASETSSVASARVPSSFRTLPLQVRVSSNSVGLRYNLSAGTHIPEDHPIDRALRTGVQIEEKSYIPFRSGKRMPAQVMAYPVNRWTVSASLVPLT